MALATLAGGGHSKAMNDMSNTGPRVREIPEGDDRQRLVCPDCGYIAYDNPKIVVGAVCLWEDRILMCRRAIEPRLGTWTIPAGYLELGETTAEGAIRETWEEAQAQIEITRLIGVYEIPHISQVYVVHEARMTSPDHAPGLESQLTELMTLDEIPWDELAFPSIRWSLERYRDGGGPMMETHVPAR